MIYSTPGLAEAVNIPLKTLNHWIYAKFFRPSGYEAPGTGRAHEFNEGDLRVLGIVLALRKRRVPFHEIGHATRALQGSQFSGRDWLLITPDEACVLRTRELPAALPDEARLFRLAALEPT